MRPSVYGTAILAFIVGGSVTFAIVRSLGMGNPELAFVVGAILGTQLAAIAHHRTPDARNSYPVKAMIGLTLALCAVGLGITLQTAFGAFKYPEVSIPFAAIGSFVFPLVLFNNMWRALSKKKNA